MGRSTSSTSPDALAPASTTCARDSACRSRWVRVRRDRERKTSSRSERRPRHSGPHRANVAGPPAVGPARYDCHSHLRRDRRDLTRSVGRVLTCPHRGVTKSSLDSLMGCAPALRLGGGRGTRRWRDRGRFVPDVAELRARGGSAAGSRGNSNRPPAGPPIDSSHRAA